MEKLIDKRRVYRLPASVGFSLMTERGELMQIPIRQVENGELPVDRELVVELMALIANLVAEVRECRQEIEAMCEESEDVIDVTSFGGDA